MAIASAKYLTAKTTAMKTRNWIILIVIVVSTGVLVFRPVPIPDEEDCLLTKGLVSQIYESGDKDISFRLHGREKIFYINRGLEQGLNLSKLKADLLNNEIT